MDAITLLRTQIDDLGFQLEACLTGLPVEEIDTKPLPVLSSAREAVTHLCEVYTATEEITRGQQHAWGSYAPPVTEWNELLVVFRDLRTKAATAVLDGDPEHLGHGSAFLVEHDAYHVGQLATLRRSIDPDWNAYSIYR